MSNSWLLGCCRWILLWAIVLCLSGCGQRNVDLANNQIGIGLPDHFIIKAEVADTEAERERGLSGRANLAADAGMWFSFEQNGKYPIWMPDMNFAIDIIWVSDDFQVVEIAQRVAPEPGVSKSQLKRYTNQSLAMYILEVPAGTAAAHKLGVGSQLELISS